MCGWGDGIEDKAVQIQELELRSQHPPVLPELKKQRQGVPRTNTSQVR